jgi:hypothetical protein
MDDMVQVEDKVETIEKEVYTVLAQQDSGSGKSLLFSYTSFDKKSAMSIAKSLAEEHGLVKTSGDYWTDRKGNSISVFKLELNKKPIIKDLFPFN